MLPDTQPIDTTPILAQPREFALRLARVERERAELIETCAKLRADVDDAQAVARAYILRTERAEVEVTRLTAALEELKKHMGFHDQWCVVSRNDAPEHECNCGKYIVDAALRGQPAPAPAKE